MLISSWPENRLVVVTLVPYLSGQGDFDGVQHTLRELWKAAAAEQKDSSHPADIYDQPGKVRLLPGIQHTPGLRWEVIDVGSDRDKCPMDVRHPEHSPHAGIMAIAAHDPAWVQAMDGSNVPFSCLSGYQVDPSGADSWSHVPILYFLQAQRGIRLGSDGQGYHHPNHAIPRFFQG